MAKMLGYMTTWTTYGTWLQGDERGYVKDGEIHTGNKGLMHSNRFRQVSDAVMLSKTQEQVVRDAVISKAAQRGQQIYALAVRPTYVHIVTGCTPQPIHRMVAYYKNAARLALKSLGRKGKLWTRGYDKRYCFDRLTLQRMIRYVRGQNPA